MKLFMLFTTMGLLMMGCKSTVPALRIVPPSVPVMAISGEENIVSKGTYRRVQVIEDSACPEGYDDVTLSWKKRDSKYSNRYSYVVGEVCMKESFTKGLASHDADAIPPTASVEGPYFGK